MKRILSMLIAVIMVLSMIPPLGAYAADPVTVYMDPANGSNENTGTEDSPVQDFTGAYALLQEAGGTIVLLGTVSYSASVTLPACDYPVTITSATGAEGISSTHNITVAGDTTFENMTLTLKRANSTVTIRGGGHKLTMGEGLTVVPCEGYYFCLEGGFSSGNDVESTELTVKSGQYRYIYAGSYGTNVTGNAKLTMTGGTATWVAACRTGSILSNVEMDFSGTAKVTDTIYGGTGDATAAGDVNGNCTITLGAGAKIATLYAGSNGAGKIAGTATVICDGYDGTFTSIQGKGKTAGTTNSSRLLLKSGTLTSAPTDFDTVDIDIPEGKTLTLACSLSADTLASSGTLNFSGAASLTVAAVTGSVACTTEGEALKNQVYVTAPAGSAITFPAESGVTEHDGKWVNQDLVNFAGLVLETDADNTLTLYTGLWRSGDTDEHTAVTPFLTETVEGTTYRYYSNLEGNYYVRGTRSGYIGVYQNIYMSPEEAATKTVETVTLEKKGTGGYVPANVYINTSEVMENEVAWKSDISMFPEEYTKYLKNPVFKEGRDAHQMTTGEELAEELTVMNDAWEDMYLYSLGQSAAYGLDIPLVILTQSDLSAATTLEQAAEELKKDSGKLTVYYRAQMHGNEPAATEGALAMLYKLQDGYADKLLDKINLIVIPRINPDGSYDYLRRLNSGLDPNRDQLRLESSEMQAVQKGYLLFDPEIVIDGHERMWNNPLGDMQISTGFTPMNSDEYRTLALALDQAAFAQLETIDLNGYYYAGTVNSDDPNMGGGYYAMSGSMYVLLESRGIHESDEAMERRVVGHMASAVGVLDYLHENAADVKALIAAERAAVASKGATYAEDDQFVLDTDSRTTTAADKEVWGNLNNIGQAINWATGEVTFPVRYPSVDDVVARSRTAPTAYVIPANLANIDNILALMTMHGISYSYLPEGATLPLQRYSGDTTTATLGAQTNVRFGQGCYVFTMNQEKGLLLATLMEPDNTNAIEYLGSLAQMELLSTGDTYRYIRDLNAQGTVDYTVTDASYVDITVWLDGTNGVDTNDGLSEANAVNTLEKAYAIMAAAMEGASAGSQANLKIVGLYELGTARVDLPSANFHVTISGKTADDGFSYTGGSTNETCIVDINGDTTFQNMTLHVNGTRNYYYLMCNGHKVVFSEGMNCTTNKTNSYFTLAGGAYSSTTAASTDLTVRSGNWRTIYAGGYTAKVTGQAKADISGCWVYQNIAPTYQGTTGSVDIKVANTTVSDYSTSAIYAGPANKNNILGDVTITLGENVVAQAVYASSRTGGDIKGTVTIIADGVDFSEAPVYAKYSATTGTTAMAILQVNKGSITQAAADFATGSNAYIRLGADSSENVTLSTDTYLDMNGKDITGSVTGEGTLLGFDSANDTYDAASCGTVAVDTDVQTVVDAPNGNRYVAVTDESGTTFHRLNVEITAVSLRTATGGLYYWADWDCDSTLAGNIKNYGIACKLNSAPDAAALSDELAGVTNGAVLYSWMENSATGDGIFADADTNDEITGAIMDGIISDEEIEGYTNSQRGQMPIYAEPYVILRSGEVVVAAGGVNYSLYTACQAIDDMITGMEASQTKTDYIAYMESLFADVWNKYGLGWNFTNFSKAA